MISISTTYRHDPNTQAIEQRPFNEHEGFAPFYGHDHVEEKTFGPFITQGACEFVLGCYANVRASKAVRAGMREDQDIPVEAAVEAMKDGEEL